MSTMPGKLLKQFNVEVTKWSLWSLGLICFLVLGSLWSQPLSRGQMLMNTVLVLVGLLQFVPLLPPFSHLRVYENGLRIRTGFGSLFIPWDRIEGFSISPTSWGDRVAIHMDPTLVRAGRVMPLAFRYRLPPAELLAELQHFLPASTVAENSTPSLTTSGTAATS